MPVILRIKGYRFWFYQKASGKPLALAMGMNTVVALATLKNAYPKTLKMRIIRL
jgi:hypothetical protein